jgi:hypothetical protein
MGGAPRCSGAVTTVLDTASRTDVGVCCPDVPPDFVSAWVCSRRQLVDGLYVPLVVGAAAARSTLRRVVTVGQARWVVTTLIS